MPVDQFQKQVFSLQIAFLFLHLLFYSFFSFPGYIYEIKRCASANDKIIRKTPYPNQINSLPINYLFRSSLSRTTLYLSSLFFFKYDNNLRLLLTICKRPLLE